MNTPRTHTGWIVSALALFVFLPLWAIFGLTWALAVLLVVTAVWLGWQLRQFHRFVHWLRAPGPETVPKHCGVWEYAYAAHLREQRRHEEDRRALRESLQRFVHAAQALPDGVIALDEGCRIEWANPQAEAHFSIDAKKDRGQALVNLVRHPQFVAYLERGRKEEEAAGESAPLFVYRDGGGSGGVRALLLQKIHYGRRNLLLLSRDISRIERLEAMRRDFVANVSHELKTPLTVVAGFSEMLNEDFSFYEPEEIRRYLGLIHEQALRMRRLIEGLLTLSRLENEEREDSKEKEERNERIELRPLLETVKAEAELLSGGRHRIGLECEGADTLRGCAGELHSAFGNLAANAVHYTPAGGTITLRWQGSVKTKAVEKTTEKITEEGVFSVTDNGIGIAAEHLPRLTERFYRVDPARTQAGGGETGQENRLESGPENRPGSGSGLGLAIVKHVLLLHQAYLKVESERGKGSRFSAHFPAARVSAAANGANDAIC